MNAAGHEKKLPGACPDSFDSYAGELLASNVLGFSDAEIVRDLKDAGDAACQDVDRVLLTFVGYPAFKAHFAVLDDDPHRRIWFLKKPADHRLRPERSEHLVANVVISSIAVEVLNVVDHVGHTGDLGDRFLCERRCPKRENLAGQSYRARIVEGESDMIKNPVIRKIVNRSHDLFLEHRR